MKGVFILESIKVRCILPSSVFFFCCKIMWKKEETVAGRTEAKTQKRKSIKNAERQHLGGEERRNSK